MLLCALIIKASELPIGKFYEIIQYKSESGGKAGLATLSIITAGMYLMLVRQTQKIVIETSSYIPADIIFPQEQEEKEFHEQSISSSKGKFSGILRNIYYLAPKILATIYRHFWRSASLIKHGCVRLLYDKYGKDIILQFYEEHAAQTPERDIIDRINEAVNNSSSKRNKAFAILSIKISNKGYFNTDGLLNNYLITKSKSNKTEKRNIQSKRFPPKKPVKITIDSAGKQSKHKVLEYSKDGSSLYILSKWPADLNKEIRILFEDSSINCEVIHKNARTYGGQVELGLALKIDEQKEKDELLSIVA